MTRIDDPDFGTIDLEPTSDEDWNEAGRAVADAIAAARHWPSGTTHDCPRCQHHTFTGRDDVRYQAVDGSVHTFYTLRGGHCTQCGLDMIEPATLMDVEKTVRVGVTDRTSGRCGG